MNNDNTPYPKHIYTDEMLEHLYKESKLRVKKLMSEAPQTDLNFINGFMLKLDHENTIMIESSNELHRRGQTTQTTH